MDLVLHDRYRVLTLLGQGAMGTVYRGHDTLLDRPVAIKVLRAGGGDGDADSERHARWLNEAQLAARLHHPHIVAVYDAGVQDGAPYIVMEYVEGRSLRSADPLRYVDIASIGRQLCDALEHAHAQGIVHRDVKPENILLQKDGGAPQAKLTDLGLALLSRSTRITQDGAIVGTASYLAPEQATGAVVDGRADLYSLGVVLYELATGRPPFTGEDVLAVISQHLHAPVVPPRTFREDIPPALEAAILACLAKNPSDRPATAHDLSAMLARVQSADGLAGGAAGPTDAPTDRIMLLNQLARGRLIGRRDELSQLQDLWRRALAGSGHMALLSGEPGVGKTRLAREIVVYAQLHGATVLSGGCYEFEAATPYLPFVEAFRQWVGAQSPDTLRATLGSFVGELARFAPQIEETLGPLPPSVPLSAQEERLRLFDAIARFLQSLASERGLLFFLDDLHWADHGTIALLHYLLRNLRDARVLFLGAYREIELDRAHPFSNAQVDWNRERLATRVSLGRLSLADTNRMLASMFGQKEASTDFAAAIHRETEGNPFFAEEVVKTLIENGEIYREGGAWQRRRVSDLTIPQSVKAAIGRRLDRLSAETMDVLHTAAALGKVFEFSELAPVCAAGEDRVLDAIDEAVRAQLLRTDRGDAFAFTHDKIREVLHDELNPVRRRRLHLRIGESLEKLYASDLAAHAQDLAHHFAESSDAHKGLTYSIAAAERSQRMYAHEEALGFYDRAREFAESLEDLDALRRVHEGIGGVLALHGQNALAAEAYLRALALTKAPAEQAALHGRIGEAYTRIGDVRGLAHLETALAGFDPETQVVDRAMALANIGRYHHYQADPDAAVRFLEEARALAEPTDDPFVLNLVYLYLAGAYQHMMKFEKSIECARMAIAMGERKNYPLAIAGGNEFVAEDSMPLGRLRESLQAADTDLAIGERNGLLDRVTWGHYCRSWALAAHGDLADAREAAARAHEMALRIGENRVLVLILEQETNVALDEGRLADARTLAEAAMPYAEAIDQLAITSAAHSAMALVLLAEGNAREAVEWCLRAVHLGEATGNKLHALYVMPVLMQALIACGQYDECADRARVYIEWCRDANAEYFLGAAQVIDGHRLLRQGALDEALAVLGDAAARLERIDAPLELARALRMRGDVHAARGAPVEARADLVRAKDLFARCGAVPERDAIEAS